MAKMWAGRTAGVTDPVADDFNSSIRFDSRMYREDITGSMAHAAMLGAQHILPQFVGHVPAPAGPAAARPAPPAAPTAVAAGEVVAAPMPGNILKVNCSQGQAVKAGDILVVLEAMKMENEILAPRDGTVAQVVTTKGAVVDTGAPLVVLA